ncbi:MAG TPA: hypothetical protein VM096_01670 [Vicinamibacterales bacterium]|nr:hypothetical protein [Vicinamibacterales bacterium]
MSPQLRELVAAGCLATLAGCGPAPGQQRRVVPSYDDFTGRLIRLSADHNGDGRIDQWSYVDGSRPIRGEADTDDDGRIDRWEYFDASSVLTVIGTSSRGDGVEDTWAYPSPSKDGETVTVTSRHRDRALDHREYFRGETLLRTEDDTNADGRIDKWQRYDGEVLREAAFDTSLQRGRADRRVQYDEKGRFAYVEEDADGDGRFVRVERAAAKSPNAPGVEQ